MTEAVISARGLVKRFGPTTAVDGVTLSVQPGELFGLIGPDGAGKTTLLRMLVTLLTPNEGEANVLGLDVVRDFWSLRPLLGYMPGRFSLYPDLTVAENLAFYAAVFGTTLADEREQIAPIWNQLERFSNRRASALSGGMKQKLALCCALVHRPQILFLDEPTTGVDAVSRREFWNLLDSLRAIGLTIMVSTPYMDEAVRCDRVALMQGGRLLAVDTPTAISAGYPLPMLCVTHPKKLALLTALRAAPHAAEVWPFGESVHYSDSRVDIPTAIVAEEVGVWLAAQGLRESVIVPGTAGIEDVFIHRMAQANAA